jgi:hypothetical protein
MAITRVVRQELRIVKMLFLDNLVVMVFYVANLNHLPLIWQEALVMFLLLAMVACKVHALKVGFHKDAGDVLLLCAREEAHRRRQSQRRQSMRARRRTRKTRTRKTADGRGI